MRRTVLGVVVACAMLAIPASANAAIVQVFGPEIHVTDNQPEEQWADDITYSRFNAWETHITNAAGNPGEPLVITEPNSDALTCQQIDPRKVICHRFTGGGPNIGKIRLGYGDDKLTVGNHDGPEYTEVTAGPGNDTINTVNGKHDKVHCGPGNDTWALDSFDTAIELVPNDEGECENTGGSGGGGSGGGGGGGGGTTPPYDPGTPPVGTPIVNPPALYPAGVASKPGGKILTIVRVNGPGVVTGKAYKSGRSALLAKGSVTATKAGAVKLTLKPTKAGKRLLKSKPKVKVKLKLAFKPTTGATVIKTVNTRIRR